MNSISIIIPCYQNENSIDPLAERLMSLAEKMKEKAILQFVFVNDGSTDNTLTRILNFKNKFPAQTKVLNLTRNFGSYNAFLAGMTHSAADCHVHLHADLQDPPELIEEMFDYYLKGIKLVIAFRKDREDASLFSALYHHLVKKIAIPNIPAGGFDLILFDEEIRQEVVAISEKSTNIVYLISWLGYSYTAIPYTRKKREHGASQWKFWKKVRLFIDTFFSFSEAPLYFVRATSAFTILSMLVLGIILALKNDLDNFTTIIFYTSFFIVILFAITLAILAEYITRIHETTRNRPNFVVDKVL